MIHAQNLKDDRGFSQVWPDSHSTRVRASLRCSYMISLMDPSPSKSVLEIGCGTGFISKMLAEQTGMSILGIDLCKSFVKEAEKNCVSPNLKYICGDFLLANILQERSFDYIVGNGILHHLFKNMQSSLSSIFRLLNPGGKIVFLEPNILNPYVYLIFSVPALRRQARLEPDEMAFSSSFARASLKVVGFDDIKIEYKDFLIPGIPTILIRPSIFAGNLFEKTPFLRLLSQSIFISARKPCQLSP